MIINILRNLVATFRSRSDALQQIKTERDAWEGEYLTLLNLARRHMIATGAIQPSNSVEGNAQYQVELAEAQLGLYLLRFECLAKDGISKFQGFQNSELKELINEYLMMRDYAKSCNLSPDEIYHSPRLAEIRKQIAELSGYACPFTEDELNPPPKESFVQARTEAEKERDRLKEAIQEYIDCCDNVDTSEEGISDWIHAARAAEKKLKQLVDFNSADATDPS